MPDPSTSSHLPILPRRPATVVLLLLALLGAAPAAADWPQYGHDPQRSHATDGALSLPLHATWIYQLPQPPAPAWPEPGKELHRIDFDHAFQPVAADGRLFVGSSADDTLRALDLATGELRWRFTADGPIRFAPVVDGDRLYVASDDGWLRCLDAATGEVHWRFRPGLDGSLVVGNGRVVSTWALRTGVALADGVLYITGGTWPSEGIFVAALDAATGEVIWRNDTSGRVFADQPHRTYAVGGVAPQGYLAVGERVLLVPTGRGRPAAFDRATGELRYVNVGTAKRWAHGGARVSIREPWFFHRTTMGTLVHVPADPGEADPVRYEGTRPFLTATGEGARQYFLPADYYNSNGFYRVLAARDTIFFVDRTHLRSTSLEQPANRGFARRRWVVPTDAERIYEMVWAGDHLLLGDRGRVHVHDATSGEKLQEVRIDGQVRGLIVADGRMIVSTDRGELLAFGAAAGDPARHGEPPTDAAPPLPGAATLAGTLAQKSIHRGLALVTGFDRPAAHLARSTGLCVVQLADDVPAMRERARPHTDLAGSRLAILGRSRLADLPARAFNVIVAAPDEPAARWPQLYRALAPHTGVLFVAGGDERGVARLEAAGIPTGQVRLTEAGILVDRGPLPAPERRVRPPFRMTWYGGPGPNRMSDRHVRDAPRPRTAAGRVAIIGEDHVMAVDAANGTELWELPMQEACVVDAVTHRTGITMSLGERILRLHMENGQTHVDLDVATGKLRRYHGLPFAERRYGLAEPRRFELAPDDAALAEARGVHGSLTLTPADDRLEIELVLHDPIPFLYDRWDLFFDFRPADRRFGLLNEPGAFHLMVYPEITYDKGDASTFLREYPRRVNRIVRSDEPEVAEAYIVHGGGVAHPDLEIEGAQSEGMRTTTLRLPWAQVAELVGDRPTTFAFAASARSNDKRIDKHNRDPFVFLRLGADADAPRLNNGWPHFDLAANEDVAAGPPPDDPRLAGAGSIPPIDDHPPVADDTAWEESPSHRPHPLTGRLSKRVIRPAYGCATPISVGATSFFRAASIAYYDFERDAGVKTIPGIRPGCRGNSGILPVDGRLLYLERSSGCSCAYNFQTSFGMVPADRPSHEDWAIYYEQAPLDAIRVAHLNFGAPGDQRDAAGRLWLGMPRPDPRLRAALPVPATWTATEGLGFYRFNADRRTVGNTDAPWIYASGLRGVRDVTVDLRRGLDAVALEAEAAPVIDGAPTEPCWNLDDPEQVLHLAIDRQVYDREYWDRYRAGDGYSDWALMRYDEQNLYFAFYNTAKVNRRGRAQAFRAEAEGLDDPAFTGDNRYEVYLGDGRSNRVLHVGVSASGARYDALCEDHAAGPEDPAWNGHWQSGAAVDEEVFAAEIAIPWTTIAEAGLDRETLALNLSSYLETPFRHRRLRNLGRHGHERVETFVPIGYGGPRPHPERTFTVRLHLAEVDGAGPGERVFDVRVNGEPAIDGLDVVAAAGGPDRALVREVTGVKATEQIHVTFHPRTAGEASATAPILSGIEVREAGFEPVEVARVSGAP